MKSKSILLIVIILAVCAVSLGTWFVVVSGPPGWVDRNVVGDDEVLVREFGLGQTVQFGTEPDQRPGIRIEYLVLSHPEGFAWIASDPNDPNQPNGIDFEWTPTETGIYYARVQATVVQPYESGQQTFSLALRVRESISPLLKWYWRIRRP